MELLQVLLVTLRLLALADLLHLEKHFSQEDLLFWFAEWARIGSGSATRSVFPKEQLFCKMEY